MPDTHAGKGSCVGFTMNLGDIVIPNIIGVDIGCGIRAVKLPTYLFGKDNLETLDNFIHANIPSGFSVRSEAPDVDTNDWYDIAEIGSGLSLDLERVGKSLGTLGGGNHFIELGVDSGGEYWLTIHSGSRNFGLQVAKTFQEIADHQCNKYYVDFGDLNFLVEGSAAYAGYMEAMKVAQMYAALNRRIMSDTILERFFDVEPVEVIDSVHNYINFEDNIIRKGATSAREGERLVIPFNMEEGLIIGTGKGNPDWNCSAPHGAGRILSRGQAKKTLNLEDAVSGMKTAGVFTTSLSQETLDEAKGAYKSSSMIVEMIQDTIAIDTWVKPVYNFKAK
jgi:RNA-splicing ligase RtcB